TSIWDHDLRPPTVLVVGGEGRGLHELTRKRCDALVSIPLAAGIESLNAGVAAGLALFEAARQRRAAAPPHTVQGWQAAQTASDQIWSILRPEAIGERPVPERHRLIFYLGHLEAFDWNLLAPVLGLTSTRPEWDKLFAFGIDPTDGALPNEPASAWPPRHEVEAYGRQIRERLWQALKRGMRDGGLEQRIEVALEHRWMHVETLTYLIHNLPYELKVQPGPS